MRPDVIGLVARSAFSFRSPLGKTPMADFTSHDFPRPPVERAAEELLAAAQDYPALIGREYRGGALQPRWELPQPPLERFPSLSLLSDPALDVKDYLEELVSIAAASAQQAEHVAEQSREASRKMRRSMTVVVGFAVVGVLV